MSCNACWDGLPTSFDSAPKQNKKCQFYTLAVIAQIGKLVCFKEQPENIIINKLFSYWCLKFKPIIVVLID